MWEDGVKKEYDLEQKAKAILAQGKAISKILSDDLRIHLLMLFFLQNPRNHQFQLFDTPNSAATCTKRSRLHSLVVTTFWMKT